MFFVCLCSSYRVATLLGDAIRDDELTAKLAILPQPTAH